MIGPKHYEGWTCKECDNLFYHELHVKSYYCRATGDPIPYESTIPTPHWCPELKKVEL